VRPLRIPDEASIDVLRLAGPLGHPYPCPAPASQRRDSDRLRFASCFAAALPDDS
jgi:hypothetical protein